MYITVPVPCVLYTIQSVILFPVMTVIVVWDLVGVIAGKKVIFVVSVSTFSVFEYNA